MPFIISHLLTISVDLYFFSESKFPSGTIFRSSFDLVCGIGLLVMTFLGFYLPEKCLYVTFILKVMFTDYQSQVSRHFVFFSFQYFKDVVPCLLGCIVSDNKFCFASYLCFLVFSFIFLSWAVFKTFVFISTFQQCIYDMLWCGSLYVSLAWSLLMLFDPWVQIFNELWKFLSHCFFKQFSGLLFPVWDFTHM